MHRNLLFYIAILLLFGAGTYLILKSGSRLQPNGAMTGKGTQPAIALSNSQRHQGEVAAAGISQSLRENLQRPLSLLLLQIIVIIVAARVAGTLFQKIGQPAVIGEIVAGILLGPSLLGTLSPEALEFLFPAPSLGILQLLSQIGVILFMFIVGTELDLHHLRRKAHAAVIISHASIIIPFFLGAALSLFIYRSLAPPQISFTGFALFIAIAMSITAFPVLARIIEERGLSRSYLGATAIACAAVDDVTAWCLLAVVIAIVKAGSPGAALPMIFLALLFIGTMVFLLKPLVGRLMAKQAQDGTWSKGLMVGVLAFAFTSAMFTEVIGIHALFGAFLAGTVMPAHDGLRPFLRDRLEALSSTVLLPIFFAFTGLRTQISLLDDWQSWLTCAVIIAVAVTGKLAGSMLAARWTGMNWHDSFSIGALMNTRGLMELIVLNMGYDLGILSGRIFAMMVLMALATTFMTGPLLSLAQAWKRKEVFVLARQA
jgi:Kef-type K+ transport system membrane component KefB